MYNILYCPIGNLAQFVFFSFFFFILIFGLNIKDIENRERDMEGKKLNDLKCQVKYCFVENFIRDKRKYI